MNELARIMASARLTTVTGAGGSGKTRVVQELASAERDRFDEGVFFVSLAPLRDAAPIAAAIADSVGLSFKPGIPHDAQLLGWLAERRVLLVLDNFEHLLDGASIVTTMLDASAGLTVVATSREPLGLVSETVFRLEGIDSAGSAELFLQSARRAFPGFTPRDDDRAAIDNIGHVVGGSPLAILLAASWVETLGPREILQEIRSSIDFLEADGRHVDERHRSMRVVFDAAWQRLSPDEQAQFAGMAVFRGGFTREAAQAVTGASLRSLAALVRHSLLHRDPSTGRYDVHELLRQYAEHRLVALHARDDAERKHAAYFAAMLQRMEQRLVVGADRRPLDEIDAELDNIRAAWDAGVRLGDLAVIGQSLTSLATFYGMRTMNQEALSRFTAALDLVRSRPDDQRPLDLELGLEIRRSASSMNLYGYGHADVEAGFTRALGLCERIGPSAMIAPVMFGLWAFYIIGSHTAKAGALATQLLDIGTSSGDTLLMIGGHHASAGSSVMTGKLGDGVRHAMRVIELYRPELDPLIIAYFADHSASATRGWHAASLTAMGQLDSARAVERDMRAFIEQLGHGQTHAQGLMFLYLAASIRRDLVGATELARELARVGDRYGLPAYIAFANAFDTCTNATVESLGALAQATSLVRDMFGFKAVTVRMTMLRQSELELAGDNASGARATAEQALAWLRERGELFFESEALRVRGDAERALGDVASAEASYRSAIDIAHAQQAKLFELRATNSLARMWSAAGRDEDSRNALRTILANFPPGSDCIDATEAAELLGQRA
jgi:predicted ATPase